MISVRNQSLTVVALALSVATAAPAQERATIEALMNEVRQLRLALEHSATIAPRLQIALYRAQLQQDKANRLEQQASRAAEQTRSAAARKREVTESIKSMEGRLASEQDVKQRKDIELALKNLQEDYVQADLRHMQEQAQESQLRSDLVAEQAKLTEVLDALGRLEQQLSAPRSTERR